MPIIGKNVGEIHISVYETPDGKNIFYINADNDNLQPVLNYVENSLENY